MIKAMDPNHPVGTATPDIDQFTLFALNTYVPMAQPGYTAAALDLLGSNVYGNAGLLYPSALQACAQTPPGLGCSLASANAAYAWAKPVRDPPGHPRPASAPAHARALMHAHAASPVSSQPSSPACVP